MSKAVLDRLVKKFPEAVLGSHSHVGNDTAVIDRDALVEIATWLRDDPESQFNLLRDVTAVDRLELGETPRFKVVFLFYSIPLKHSFRLEVPLEEDDARLPSLTGLYGSANWGERECWDMYGMVFEGHPDLRRILLYEEFEGHPLRKDYQKRQSQPRLDLTEPERDAIAEYKEWRDARTQKST